MLKNIPCNFTAYLIPCLSVFANFSLSGKPEVNVTHENCSKPCCMADFTSVDTFIPPRRTVSAQANNPPSTDLFNTAFRNVPEAAKTAIIYALDLWDDHISSPVPIDISFTWREFDNEGGGRTLASASPGTFLNDLPAFPQANVFYPIALADRFLRQSQFSNRYDIRVNLGADIPWYFGIDGNCPPSQFDLVSVVLHEVGHGLGIIDTANPLTPPGSEPEDATRASIGFVGGDPFPYDTLLTVNTGEKLLNNPAFPNLSESLLTVLTDGDLFLTGPVLTTLNLTQNAVVYTPSEYDSGSSIAHLDENTYRPGNENSLMTPFLSRGEVVHDPGPIILAALADMGWQHTWFIHENIRDIEDIETPIVITTGIESDNTALNELQPIIHYRMPNVAGNPFQSMQMVFNNESRQFEATLPAPIDSTTLGYRFEVEDSVGRVFTFPREDTALLFNARIGFTDIQDPIINHTTDSFIFSYINEYIIEVEVTDNVGIESVVLDWNLDGGAERANIMESVGNNRYRVKLEFPNSLAGFNQFNYRFVVTDSSGNSNVANAPITGFFQIPIEAIFPAVIDYQNDFDQGDVEIISEGMGISTPNGFDSANLGTPHPYASPEQSEAFFEYTAVLRKPIIVQPNTAIRFNEIVLVEPGEDGTLFGDFDFWDFVVVEATSNGGQTWFPLTDGWDSRDNPIWQNRYNSNLVSNNSRAVGTPLIFRQRTISLSQTVNVEPGDFIIIRFRLFSDPFANGWGWAIDNLEISSTGF